MSNCFLIMASVVFLCYARGFIKLYYDNHVRLMNKLHVAKALEIFGPAPGKVCGRLKCPSVLASSQWTQSQLLTETRRGGLLSIPG